MNKPSSIRGQIEKIIGWKYDHDENRDGYFNNKYECWCGRDKELQEDVDQILSFIIRNLPKEIEMKENKRMAKEKIVQEMMWRDGWNTCLAEIKKSLLQEEHE